MAMKKGGEGRTPEVGAAVTANPVYKKPRDPEGDGKCRTLTEALRVGHSTPEEYEDMRRDFEFLWKELGLGKSFIGQYEKPVRHVVPGILQEPSPQLEAAIVAVGEAALELRITSSVVAELLDIAVGNAGTEDFDFNTGGDRRVGLWELKSLADRTFRLSAGYAGCCRRKVTFYRAAARPASSRRRRRGLISPPKAGGFRK